MRPRRGWARPGWHRPGWRWTRWAPAWLALDPLAPAWLALDPLAPAWLALDPLALRRAEDCSVADGWLLVAAEKAVVGGGRVGSGCLGQVGFEQDRAPS